MTLELPFVFDPKPSPNTAAYGGANIYNSTSVRKFSYNENAIANVAPHALTVRVFQGAPTAKRFYLVWAYVAQHRTQLATTPGISNIHIWVNVDYNVMGFISNFPLNCPDMLDNTNVELKVELTSPILLFLGGGNNIQLRTEDNSTGGAVSYRGAFAWISVE